METSLIDSLVFYFSIIFYALLFIIYILRAHELSEIEWKLSPVFSAQLVPFASLWVLNYLFGNDPLRLLAVLPIIIYLIYDLWYRAVSGKKPYHHPDRWPSGLILYILLLLIGCVGLNWYGYLISKFFGNILVISFFVMMTSFSYYQYRYKNRDKTVH